jgi:hypothetical protein
MLEKLAFPLHKSARFFSLSFLQDGAEFFISREEGALSPIFSSVAQSAASFFFIARVAQLTVEPFRSSETLESEDSQT